MFDIIDYCQKKQIRDLEKIVKNKKIKDEKKLAEIINDDVAFEAFTRLVTDEYERRGGLLTLNNKIVEHCLFEQCEEYIEQLIFNFIKCSK